MSGANPVLAGYPATSLLDCGGGILASTAAAFSSFLLMPAAASASAQLG